MRFQDHEKRIYTPPGRTEKYDPLALDRELTLISAGELKQLILLCDPAVVESGDIRPEGRREALLHKAAAEDELVKIARKAFALPAFPDCTDAEVLECLYDYLRWMEKKGERGETPPDLPQPMVSPPEAGIPSTTSPMSV